MSHGLFESLWIRCPWSRIVAQFVLLGGLIVITGTATAAPVLPGLSREHPLSEPELGRLLIDELRCAACHGDKAKMTASARTAPALAEVGARVSPEYLKRFLASPSRAHEGTTMPEMLASQPAEQQAQIAETLTHFLVAQSPTKFSRTPIVPEEVAAGKSLFHTIGCVACHAPREEDGKEVTRDGVVTLSHLAAKYSVSSLAQFVHQPLNVRASGRMPDMKLTKAESQSIAHYLISAAKEPAAPTPTAFEPKPELVAAGKKHFEQLNCAACHQLGDIPATTVRAKDLLGVDVTRGCLSQKPGPEPHFSLSDTQTLAIRAALEQPSQPLEDSKLLASTLLAFNCIACHVRDEFGGVDEERNPFFTTSERELGDEARIPPPLTLVGAKLQPVALKKMLFDGDSARPYMFTRMPQFGEANLRHLPALFAKLDSVQSIEWSLPKSEDRNEQENEIEREMRAAGRELVGDKGLSCVACHTFHGKGSNKKGIDLMTFPERLNPNWYYHYVIDPAAFRPRTVMPTGWRGGVASHKTLLGGDTNRQIAAIWYYLSLGTSAQTPSGVQNIDSILTVTDNARVYRGRSGVAGYRGIAVGLPGKLNYAFNAETGSLTAIWSGDFVRVNWSGQGSGDFNPAHRPAQLAQDIAFYELPDETAPWPLRPVMTKEAPANPDPHYPKNRGYQFQGYHLGTLDIPTLRYRSGEVEIEDRSVAELTLPDPASGKPRLVRTLTLNSPTKRTFWLRALTGNIESETKQQFKTPELRLSIPAMHTVLRPNTSDEKSRELLLQFEIPQGKSTQVLTYELLQK